MLERVESSTSEESTTGSLEFTWDFTPEGREEFQTVMRAVAYGERESDAKVLQLLIDNNMIGGFWCYNCSYFKAKANTSTGSQCKKYGFPDRAHGCCAGQEAK